MTHQRFTRERSGPPGPRETRWTWLLLIPLAGSLIPPIYNTHDPELFGVPFFYWYQMALDPGQRAGHDDRLPGDAAAP